MIDYEADTPVYEQIAADIRRRIAEGEWGPRRRLPSVTHLEQQYGVARNTVLQALAHMRDLGVIYTVKNRGSFVRAGADTVTVVAAEPGMRVFARRPNETEREDLQLAEDGWVLIVERTGGDVEVFPADKVEIRGPEG